MRGSYENFQMVKITILDFMQQKKISIAPEIVFANFQAVVRSIRTARNNFMRFSYLDYIFVIAYKNTV